MTDQGWLWPTLKHALFDDLKRVHDKVGPWDAVIFSGDFTQRAAREEFNRLDGILTELWRNFSNWGFQPQLVTLPGNHDLVRPSTSDPEILLLNRWWDESRVRED